MTTLQIFGVCAGSAAVYFGLIAMVLLIRGGR